MRCHMTADTAAPTATCTCRHPQAAHNARRPEGACTACTQCDGLLACLTHDWHRCYCLEFEPRPRNAIEAEIAGDIEVLEPARGARNATD